MPEKKTINRARKAQREGKAPSTAAGEFVREEIHHVREGKHGAKNPKQAIAIGLSKARRSGVDVPPSPTESAPKKKSSASGRSTARKQTKRSSAKSKAGAPRRTAAKRPAAKRSRASTRTPKRGARGATSTRAPSRQGRGTTPRRKRGGATRAREEAT
jgi:hypothetical protein